MVVDRAQQWLEEHAGWARAALAATGITGAVIVARAVRLGNRFGSASAVPDAYVKRSVPLRALVQATELVQFGDRSSASSSASRLIVRVKHVPLISTQWLRPQRENSASELIALVVAEVAVQEAESPALADILEREVPTGTRVQFRPLKKISLHEETVLEAIVKQKPGSFRPRRDLGVLLVGQGLATPLPYDMGLTSNAAYASYYKRLLAAEEKASAKKKGIWAAQETEKTSFLKRLVRAVRKLGGRH